MGCLKCLILIFFSLVLGACTGASEGNAPGDATSPIGSENQLSITPSDKIIAINNNFNFMAAGGMPPYNFTIASGGGVILTLADVGQFTASNASGAVVVQLTDSSGAVVTASVTVKAALQISPTLQTVTTGGTLNMSASGGVSPYFYSISSGSGSIDSLTGVYTAPSTNTVANLIVTDSIGNTSSASITVTSVLSINPSSIHIVVGDTQIFAASGGTSPFTYSIVSGAGTINSLSGLYTAGMTSGPVVIRVTDALGAIADAAVTVAPALVISPVSSNLIVNGTLALTVSGGVGPHIFSIRSGAGSINSTTGLFTASAAAGTTVIRVTDSQGHTADSTITVIQAAPTISNISNQTVKSDASLVINYTLSDPDNSLNCSTSVTVTSSVSSVLPVTDIIKSGTAPNCILTIAPSLNLAGITNLNITATDGILSDSKTFTVDVVNVLSVVLNPTSFSLAIGGISQVNAIANYSDFTSANSTSNINANWSSSNSTVATVNTTSAKGLVTGVATGVTNINLSYKGLSQSSVVTVYNVVGLSLSKGAVTGGIGSQASVTATAQTTNLSFDVTSSAAWTTSNPAVATVSSNGSIQFVGSGSAIVTVSYAGYSATVNVSVQSKSLVSLQLSIAGGGTSVPVSGLKNLILTGTYSDTSTEILTNSAIWSSTNDSVLTVSNVLPNIGKVTGIVGGTSTVTAAIGTVTGSLLVTVNNVTLVSIAINPGDALVASGATYNLQATGTYSDASTADVTELVTWSSSNTTAATISNVVGQKGLATTPTFTGYRSTTISATLSGVTGATALGVNGATISSIIITPSISIMVNQSYQLKAYGNLSDGGVIDLTHFAIWSTSNISKVSVSNSLGSKGDVTGVALGTSTITAAFNGVSGTRTVTVSASANLTEIGIGLLGSYYTWTGGPPPTSPFLVANKKGARIDQKINFGWGSGDAPMGVGNQFSVRWTGSYKATATTNYFCTNSDDGIRVWINGNQVINNWTEHGPMWDCTGDIPLVIGTKYSIVIEYYENGGGSEAHLTRSSVSAVDAQNTVNRIVPQIDLYPN
jgi:uncharacterized protein YjdB